MRQILILTKDYFKLSSPNAICIQGIVNEWKHDNIEIDIISAEDNKCISDDHNIYICKSTTKFRKIQKILSYPLDSNKLVKEYENALEVCISKEAYDLIIAVVNPTETAEALCNIKKKNPKLKTCLYEIDPISNRYKTPTNFLERYLTHRALKWSCKVYNQLDYVIHMVSHRKHFEKDVFRKFKDKTFYLDIPALRTITKKENVDLSKDIHIVYAGAFYKDLRNPEKIIEALKLLCEKYPLKISIYTNQAMIHDIRKMTEYLNSNFYISNYIPEQELNTVLLSASFLLSVGNKESDFLPSKIFTYIGMNKPIIHYTFDSDDAAIPYLKKYGNTLFVSDDYSVEFIAEKIEKYILNKETIFYSKDEILSKFIENTPAYSAKQIIDYCQV